MERIKVAIEKARHQAALSGLVNTGETPILRAAPTPGVLQRATIDFVNTDVEPLDMKHLERNRVVSFDRSNPWSRDFDLLRTQVLQKMQENGWQTLAVTSPTTQCGKTVVSINLGMSIAHHPQTRATLVDFDLRRPRIASYLGLTPRTCLNEVLQDDARLETAIVCAGLPRLFVLPTHRPIPSAAEMLGTDKVDSLLASLRTNNSDPIIIDLPPVTAVDDAIALLPKIDCVLLVIANGQCTKRQIEETLRHLSNANVVGMVFNKSTAQLRNKDNYYYY